MASSENDLVEGVACSIFEQHHSSLLQSMTSPSVVATICRELYSKRCVDESTLKEFELINTSLEDKIKSLLDSLRSMISIDYRNLVEIATVLSQFKETKSTAKNIINDCDQTSFIRSNKKRKRQYSTSPKALITKQPRINEEISISAKEAIKKNITRLNDALVNEFQFVVLACEEKEIITSEFSRNLLDLSTTRSTQDRVAALVKEMQNIVSFQPDCLDIFLCILVKNGGIPGSVVANDIANDYGYELPQYALAINDATSSSGSGVVESGANYNERASDIFRTHYSDLMQSLKNPVTIARLLYEEKIIAKDVLIKVESVKQPQKEKVSILLSSVKHAVSNKHHNLLLFGKCLEKVAENFLLGRAIIKDYKNLFEEAVTCHEHEDSILFETTNVKATTVPTATMAQTATTGAEKQINVPVSVQPTFSTMRAMFGRMFFNVRKAIAVHDIPIEDIKEFVICSYPYLKPSISHCETILDILMIVQEKCSLINVSLLDAIVHQFEIKEAKKFVAEYKNEIETFCGNVSVRLSLKEHFILNDNYSNLLCCEIAVFVLDWDADDCDMYTINDVKCILAHAFERLEINVQIVVINECNSVAVICSFPVEITALLIAEAIKHFKILQKKGLVKLTIGCCTILDTRNEEEESDIRYQIPIITEVTTEEPSQKDDASDDIDLQSESAADKSELLGSDKDDTLCQQPDEEEQTFGHSLSTASSDHLLIIRDLTQKNEHLQAQLKSQEDYIQSLSESELSKVLEQTQKINKKIQMEKEQILKNKTKEIKELQEKISSQSVTLLDKEKTIKNLESQYKENKLILEKFLSKVYSPSETTSVPEQSDPEKKVEWNKSGRGQVVLTSPSPSDCVGVINDLLNESVQCETIELQSSSPEAALALLSPLYQISSAKILRIKDTPLTNEMIYCLNEVIKSDQLEEIHFINASLGASGEMHSLADAIASNKSLRWLEVWDDRTLTDDDAENISKMLADNKTLETFQFGDCNLNNNHLQHLIKNLADNTTLKVLDISMNPITSTGDVCDIIKLSSLVELYLHNVSLPADDSTVQLMDALSTNETIKILSIDKRHEQFCQKHKKFEDLEERVRFR